MYKNNFLFPDEFHRAVKICTGTNLSLHLVHTVFAIFDDDGDGLLSYREFIAIMKDRLHRGFKVSIRNKQQIVLNFFIYRKPITKFTYFNTAV